LSLARSFVVTGDEIAKTKKLDDAVICYDEVVTRFGESTDIEIRRQVRIALVKKGRALVGLGRLDDADATFDELCRRARQAQDSERAIVQALRTIALTYSNAGHNKRALVASNLLFGLFAENISRPVLMFSAWSVKSDVLSRAGRAEEALSLLDEFVDHHENMQEPWVPEFVARAFNKKAGLLKDNGDYKKALQEYDALLVRFADVSGSGICKSIATALHGKLEALQILKKYDSALLVADEILRRFAHDMPPLYVVLDTLSSKAWMLLYKFKHEQEAAKIYEQIIERYGEESDNPYIRERIVNALEKIASIFLDEGNNEEVIRTVDVLRTNLGGENGDDLSMHIVRGLNYKALALSRLGRLEEAVDVDEEALTRFSGVSEPLVLEALASILGHMGYCLRLLGRFDEALDVWDEISERYSDVDLPNLRIAVGDALKEKTTLQALMGRSNDAMISASALAELTDNVTGLDESVRSAEALVAQGAAMLSNKRFEDAIRIFDEVIDRFDASLELELREVVTHALYSKATGLECLGNKEEATEVFRDMLSRFGEEALHMFDSVINVMITPTDLSQREGIVAMYYGKAVALRDLGRNDEALSTIADLIARFGCDKDCKIQETISDARRVQEGILEIGDC
jgi:tetratricopeptide (TPR) repeat protein